MSQSRTDLVVEILGLLNVIQVGQDPEADDREVVEAKIDTTFATLASNQTYYVQDPDNIDDEAFNALAVLVANAVGPKFGQSFDPDTQTAQEAELRRIQIIRRRSSVQWAEYF